MKKILIILILGILIIVLTAGLIFYLLYSVKNNSENNSAIKLELDEDSLELKGGPIVGPYAVLLKEIADIMAGCERPINFRSERYRLSYSNKEEDKKEGEYEGFRWLNEKGEIELIKDSYGLSLEYNHGNPQKAAKYFPECAQLINNYLLSTGFISNDKNNYIYPEKYSYDYPPPSRFGFGKDNIKCVVNNNTFWPEISVVCGNVLESNTPVEFREIYKDINPLDSWGMWVSVDQIVDNFALGRIGGTYGPTASWVIFKKDNNKWIRAVSTQDEWACDELLKADVSPAVLATLLENTGSPFNLGKCTDYAGDGWEKDYEKLYQEKTGEN